MANHNKNTGADPFENAVHLELAKTYLNMGQREDALARAFSHYASSLLYCTLDIMRDNNSLSRSFIQAMMSQEEAGEGEQLRPHPKPDLRVPINMFGVPLRIGSIYPAMKTMLKHIPNVQLLAGLQAVGCHVIDEWDVALPSYLPHHTIPPIRNWSGPRIARDYVSERILPFLQQPGHDGWSA